MEATHLSGLLTLPLPQQAVPSISLGVPPPMLQKAAGHALDGTR